MNSFSNYEINEGTLAILPSTKNKSKVLEDDNEYVVEKIPYEILEDSCSYFGSSYEGRKYGSKKILGADYKVPIIVEDSRNLIFFPTISPRSLDCIWFSSKRIKSYEKIRQDSTKVTFDNGKTLNIPISFRSFENQLLRAARLDYIIRNRK